MLSKLVILTTLCLSAIVHAYDCSDVATYVDGNRYSTDNVVKNKGNAYKCLVGGWCTVGGPYAPGTGWARVYVWSSLGACSSSSSSSSSSSGGTVTVYQHCNFDGWSAKFGTGSFNSNAIVNAGGANNGASSIRIPNGYQVTLYRNDNYSGNSVTLTSDTSCFVGINFNDILSSMVVKKSGSSSSSSSSSSSGSFQGGVGNVYQSRNGYSLNFTSKDPNLSSTLGNHIIETFFTTYSQEAAHFNPNGYKNVNITVDPAVSGVAYTTRGGDSIFISASYIDNHPEDYDVVTHEAMHVAQNYVNGNSPGYWVEGLADYARAIYGVNNGKAGWAMPNYSAGQSYKDAYRVTARFLVWLDRHVDSSIPQKLDDVLRSGSFSDASFWPQNTGYTVDQLWSQYAANPAL